MTFDETLAGRVRAALRQAGRIQQRRMFGGLAFMIDGHMCVGILGKDLVVRLGPGAGKALERPHTRAMDFTGRPMNGFLYVEPKGTARDATLQAWVDEAAAFARSLPPKAGKKRPRR